MALDHRLERGFIGLGLGALIALAAIKLIGYGRPLYAYNDTIQELLLIIIAMSGLIGVTVAFWIGMELKYRRLHQFVYGLRYYGLRQAMLEDLFDRATRANNSSDTVSRLQNKGLVAVGYSEGADYGSIYRRLQDDFRENQSNLFRRYDLAQEFVEDFKLGSLPEKSMAKILEAKQK